MTRASSDAELEVRALENHASMSLSTTPLEGIADDAVGPTFTRNVFAVRDVERAVSVPIAEVSTTVDPAAAHDSVTSTTHDCDDGHSASNRHHDDECDASTDSAEPEEEVSIASDNSTIDQTTTDIAQATSPHDSSDTA